MSSRKRKDPNPPESPRTPSKRTRFQQTKLQNSGKSIGSGPACKYGTSRAAYAINNILDESEDKYLIDWAPDLTGNTWSPDWQLKKNANATAVKLWETQKSTKNTHGSSRRPRLTITHRNAKEHLQHAANDSPVRTQAPETLPTNDKPQPEIFELHKSLEPLEQSQLSVQAASSSLDISKFPDVAVQIEPRESLDKEAYIAYNSSLSNREARKSSGPHSDSGFEESSSRENSPFHRRKEKSIIVPDSQSTVGSSSYVPNQQTLNSSESKPTDPVELSSGIVIPASQPSKAASRRSGSEPAPNVTEISNTSSIDLTSSHPLQTVSDPEGLLDNNRAQRFIPRKRPNRRVIIDSPSPSQASPPNHQPEVPLKSIEPSEDLTQVQILGSESNVHFREEDLESPAHSPIFVTQAPLDLGQNSPKPPLESYIKPQGPSDDPPTATSKALPAGQRLPATETVSSEVSLGSLPQVKASSEQTGQVREIASAPVISEGIFIQASPSKATTADLSSLDKKVSVTRSEGYSHHTYPKAIDTIKKQTLNTRPTDLLPESSELLNIQGQPLPDTLDSRVPPKPPSSSDIDMSDNAQAGGDLPSESRMDRMRRKLQDARATSDAKLAAQKVERKQSTLSPDPPSPVLERTEIDAKAKSVIAAQSPRGSKSPSLARIAVTPKGPLSPVAIGSPLGIQVFSPRSTRSPTKIPQKEPYPSQEEPSFLGVDPTNIAKELLVPATASPHASLIAGNTILRGGESVSDEITSTQSDSLPQTISLHVQNLGPMEFVMPLSMPPRTQKQYVDTYRYFHRKISLFGEGKNISRDLVEDLNVMLDRVAKVTTHMDLDGGGPGEQDDVDVIGEAGYAVSVSEKFRFLGFILTLARDLDIHIVIVARPGQLCEFIQTTLKAQRVDYSYPSSHEGGKPIWNEFGSRLKVTLLASSGESSAPTRLLKKADVIIAFDETFNGDSAEFRALPDSSSIQGLLVPVIRLVVYATLEHIHLCLPMTLEPNDRLRRLLFYMMHAEAAVGQLAPENLCQSQFDPQNCAEQLVEFVRTGAIPGTLILPSIPPIEDLPLIYFEPSPSDSKSEISDSLKPGGTIRYWPSVVHSNPSPGQRISGGKRPFDLEYGDSVELQQKKMRMGNMVNKGRQLESSTALREYKDNERIKVLEKQLQYAEANNYDPDNPMSWQSRVKIFDEASRERRELRATVAELNAIIERITFNLGASREETAIAKAALADIKAKNENLHEMLLTNASPNVQQAELARRRLQELEAIDAAKTKRINNTENELAFTRKVYQEASTAASTASSDLDALRSHLKAIETLLTAAQRERRNARANERSSLQPHLKEKAALKETLKQRDKELQALKLELDGLKRGRQGVQTRGSSMQPVGARSPRGSRGVSPAVGGLVPGGHGPGHQGGVAMARGPSGLGISSRLGSTY